MASAGAGSGGSPRGRAASPASMRDHHRGVLRSWLSSRRRARPGAHSSSSPLAGRSPQRSPGAAAAAAADSPPLPRGWEQRTDNNGRTYFVNTETRSTSASRPDAAADAFGASSAAAASLLAASPSAPPSSSPRRRSSLGTRSRWHGRGTFTTPARERAAQLRQREEATAAHHALAGLDDDGEPDNVWPVTIRFTQPRYRTVSAGDESDGGASGTDSRPPPQVHFRDGPDGRRSSPSLAALETSDPTRLASRHGVSSRRSSLSLSSTDDDDAGRQRSRSLTMFPDQPGSLRGASGAHGHSRTGVRRSLLLRSHSHEQGSESPPPGAATRRRSFRRQARSRSESSDLPPPGMRSESPAWDDHSRAEPGGAMRSRGIALLRNLRSRFSRSSRRTGVAAPGSSNGDASAAAAGTAGSSGRLGSRSSRSSLSPPMPIHPRPGGGRSWIEVSLMGPPPGNSLSTRAQRLSAYEQVRDEILDVIAMAVLDRQEVEAGEVEMARLERLQEVHDLHVSLVELEDAYARLLMATDDAAADGLTAIAAAEPTSAQARDLQERLVLARLLLWVARLGAELVGARQRHGLRSPEAREVEESLTQHLGLLTRASDGGLAMQILMHHEHSLAQERIRLGEVMPIEGPPDGDGAAAVAEDISKHDGDDNDEVQVSVKVQVDVDGAFKAHTSALEMEGGERDDDGGGEEAGPAVETAPASAAASPSAETESGLETETPATATPPAPTTSSTTPGPGPSTITTSFPVDADAEIKSTSSLASLTKVELHHPNPEQMAARAPPRPVPGAILPKHLRNLQGGELVGERLDYRIKNQRLRLKNLRMREHGKTELPIQRTNMLETSRELIMKTPATKLKRRLFVKFQDEDGKDYGGLLRDWLHELSHEMTNICNNLFEYAGTDTYTLQITPNPDPLPEQLEEYEFIGRVVGLAVFHGKLLDAFFIRPFYKMMLGQDIVLADMEFVNAEYYRSLCYLLDNDGAEELGLTFEVDQEIAGEMTTFELKPDSADLCVTDSNKAEYVELMISWRFRRAVQAQMDAFLRGFHLFVRPEDINAFSPSELELLICGLAMLDLEDWKSNTVYENGYKEDSPIISNFWKVMRSFDSHMQARVLQFVTGTSRVPAEGFAGLQGTHGPCPFSIYRNDAVLSLPVGHTCINRLDLPPYDSVELLEKKLRMAVEETAGFGIV